MCYMEFRLILIDSLYRSDVPSANLVAFCALALRHGADQTITAAWHLNEAVVGTLASTTRLNGLDPAADFVLSSRTEPQVISARKLFAGGLACDHFATARDGPAPVRLQGVDIADWVSRAVLAGGPNYTIQGTTEFRNLTVFGDTRVFGLVNGLPFTPAGILLTTGDQQLLGNLTVSGNVREQIRPLSINDGRFERVNGVPVDAFLANLAHADAGGALETRSPLRFERPPVVQSFRTAGTWNGRSVPQLVAGMRAAIEAANHTDQLGVLRRVGVQLVAHVEHRPRQLRSMRLVQTLDEPGVVFR